jgi:hypothetical protein
LESLEGSSNYIKEIIIIENDSPDKHETQMFCNTFDGNLEIKFRLNENVGFGKSCNLGAKISKSKYILFLNPDTRLLEDSIKILYEHMYLSEADIVGGKALDYKGKMHGSVVRMPNLFVGLFEFSNLGKLLGIEKAHNHFYYDDIDVTNLTRDEEVDAVSGAYLLVSRQAFNNIGGFDDRFFMYLEDVDFCKRAIALGFKTMFCPHSKILHIGGFSSKNKYRINHQAWFDSRRYYFKKHFSIFVNLLIQPLYSIEEFLLKKYRIEL